MVTLKQVATEAGVSISTVSRVLNTPNLVNEETRVRVQQTIARLQYRPSRVARRLRVENGRAHLVGLMIPDMQNPFFSDLARGVEDVAHAHDSAVLLCNSDEDFEKEALYVHVMLAESVDGVIIPPIDERDPAVRELAQSGLPVVCVDRRLSRVVVDTVVADNVQGAYDAVDLLLRLGHRRIGCIEGLPRLSTSRERFEGYAQALRDHDVPLDMSIVRQGDSRQEGGRRMAEELLHLPERPTALFVGNNLMTLGALEAIHRLGVRIPTDLAVVGYDDMPWAPALNPPLTAVRQPGYEMGRRAAELLWKRIEEPDGSPTLVTLQPRLVVRQSCGSPAELRS